MRWVPWALGIAGVLQFTVMAFVGTDADYVSLDTAYLVMWLAVIGAFVVCYLSCWGGGGCGCCGDGCECGDCGDCAPHGHGGHGDEHAGHGHEGHSH